MADIKRGEVFVFVDGQLRIKTEGHGDENGWGEFIFDEEQVEIVPHEECSGCSHVIEIPRSELIALRDFLNRAFPRPERELPCCIITGRIAGDSDACGDCDPCSAASRVPESIKRLLAEKDEWRSKYGDAAARLDTSPVAPVQAEREAVYHSPRCDCGSLFEICRYPNCECGGDAPPTSGSQG